MPMTAIEPSEFTWSGINPSPLFVRFQPAAQDRLPEPRSLPPFVAVVHRTRAAVRQSCRERSHRWRAEEFDNRNLTPESLLKTHMCLHEQERVATHVEEIVVRADASERRYAAPRRRC